MSGIPATGHIDLPHNCPSCGHARLVVAWGLRAKRVGDFSLSGANMKFSAVPFCEVSCGHCGMWAPGKLTDDAKVENGEFVAGHFEATGPPRKDKA